MRINRRILSILWVVFALLLFKCTSYGENQNKTISSLSRGDGIVTAVLQDGTVWECYFGLNPKQITDLKNIISFDYNNGHALALKNDGTVLSGQLKYQTWTWEPVIGLTDIKEVKCGLNFWAALKKDGTVWAWGDNFSNQLNSNVKYSNEPIQIKEISDVKSISCGDAFTLALKQDGSVWSWGDSYYNYDIEKEENGTSFHPIVKLTQINELHNIISVSAGSNFGLALDSDGKVWSWGENSDGQLGNGTFDYGKNPMVINKLNNITSISVDRYHSIALRNDGTIWVWGDNYGNKLDVGQEKNVNTPVIIKKISKVKKISTSMEYVVALFEDNSLWACGNDTKGSLPSIQNNDDRLKSVSINGKVMDISNFTNNAITVTLQKDIKIIPKVVAKASDSKAKVYVTQAIGIPGSAKILVIAEDTAYKESYIVNFKVQGYKQTVLTVDGAIISLRAQIIKSGDTILIPAEQTFDALWVNHQQKGKSSIFCTTQNNKTISFDINRKLALVDGKEIQLKVPIQKIKDIVYIPTEFLEKCLGCMALLDANSNIVNITSYDEQVRSFNENGSISLSAYNKILYVGDQEQINVIIDHKPQNINDEICYYSYNNTASIDKNGMIKVLAEGPIDINVSYLGKSTQIYLFAVKEGTFIVNNKEDIYNSIKTSIQQSKPEIRMLMKYENYDGADIYDSMDKVANEEFGYDSCMIFTSVSSTGIGDYSIKSINLNLEEINKCKQVKEKADEIIKQIIKPQMSERDIVKAIHDYVVNCTDYDFDNFLKGTIPYDSATPYGVLINKKAVCAGYADTMRMLLSMAGIENYVVGGSANGYGGWGGHAWNIVKIDGKYYHVDATFDDPIGGNIRYNYFLINDNQISIDHKWDNSKFPECK